MVSSVDRGVRRREALAGLSRTPPKENRASSLAELGESALDGANLGDGWCLSDDRFHIIIRIIGTSESPRSTR
jgi:hypothetical protein